VKPKELVYAAVNHEEVGFVPFQLSFTEEISRALDDYCGGPGPRAKAKNLMAGTGPKLPQTDLDEKRYRDAWGVTWTKLNIPHIEAPVLPEPNLRGYEFPDLADDALYEHVDGFLAEHPDEFTVFGMGMSFFERAWALRGMENILCDMMLNERFTNELFDGLMELHLTAIGKVRGKPFDAFRFGDDFGAQHGLIMGDACWRRYLKPRLRRMYGAAHDAGYRVMIHSCGDNSSIMGDLIEIGVDIFNPFQPEAMDVFEMKRRHGPGITFSGGIGTQRRLVRGPPEAVRGEVRALLRRVGRGGGLIAETTKPIRPETPPENAAACVEELVGQMERAGP